MARTASSSSTPNHEEHIRFTLDSQPGRFAEPFSRLFINQAGEGIQHLDHDISQYAQTREEQPDRVFGLHRTHNLEELLMRLGSDKIQTSPFKRGSDSLVYPFLVLEAKREASATWMSVKLQTAFPIRTFLQMQADLIQTDSSNTECVRLPLVWFLAYKGSTWLVQACFTRIDNGTCQYVRCSLLSSEGD